MIGVGWAPPSRARPRQAACSSSCDAQAMWGTDPAPWMPGSGGAGSWLHRAGELEERHDRPRAPLLVAVVEVVDVGLVVVDGLLDEPQTEHLDVEVDVALGIARDRRHVVDAFQAHRTTVSSDG